MPNYLDCFSRAPKRRSAALDGLLEFLGEEVLSGELGGIALAELVEEVGGVFGVVGAFPRAGVG